MLKLNLPSFDYKLRKEEGKVWIFDGIRKKYIVLTPEEWVRQHFIHYLINEKKYPRSLMRIEGGLRYNALQKRSDIVVYDVKGLPWLVVECKAPHEPISQATVHQASVYNATLKAPYIAVTNGIHHVWAKVDWTQKTTALLDDAPPFTED